MGNAPRLRRSCVPTQQPRWISYRADNWSSRRCSESPAPQFGLLAHTAYVGGALGTFIYTDMVVWLGLVAGVAALVCRIRGGSVNAFGIAIVGFIVSLLATAHWLYIESMFLFS